MADWKNTEVISCLDGTGGLINVIEQTRLFRTQEALSADDDTDRRQRYVLGNGDRVRMLDSHRFELPETHEIVIRRNV